MAVFVLVHGAWHGAWCWERLAPRLRALGHQVSAIDLPGSGEDTTPLSEVTLGHYVAFVGDLLERLDEPVVLVGHSLGGITLTQIAETMPARIRKLIYLAAFIPQDGESAVQALARLAPEHPRMPVERILDGAALVVNDGAVADLFYGDCLSGDMVWAKSRLRPHAVEPMVAPVTRTAARFGKVPRAYIACTADNAIPFTAQQAMAEDCPGTEMVTMHTDHSPFLCAPETLAMILHRLAQA